MVAMWVLTPGESRGACVWRKWRETSTMTAAALDNVPARTATGVAGTLVSSHTSITFFFVALRSSFIRSSPPSLSAHSTIELTVPNDACGNSRTIFRSPRRRRHCCAASTIETTFGIAGERLAEMVMIDRHMKVLCDFPAALLQLQAEIVVLSPDVSIQPQFSKDFAANQSKLRNIIAKPPAHRSSQPAVSMDERVPVDSQRPSSNSVDGKAPLVSHDVDAGHAGHDSDLGIGLQPFEKSFDASLGREAKIVIEQQNRYGLVRLVDQQVSAGSHAGCEQGSEWRIVTCRAVPVDQVAAGAAIGVRADSLAEFRFVVGNRDVGVRDRTGRSIATAAAGPPARTQERLDDEVDLESNPDQVSGCKASTRNVKAESAELQHAHCRESKRLPSFNLPNGVESRRCPTPNRGEGIDTGTVRCYGGSSEIPHCTDGLR